MTFRTPLTLRSLTLAAVAAPLAYCSFAAPEPAQAVEPLVIPLSQPGRPAKIVVSLVSGSITVRGHDAAEVWLEAAPVEPPQRPQSSERHPEGMTRIPNLGMGLQVDEVGNEVRVSASPRQRLAIALRVPRDSSLSLTTVNHGEIVVEGVRGALDLNNTNGGVRALGVTGPVSATTVNGAVEISFERIGAEGGAMAFTTLNGSITLTLPATTAATLRLRSDNGEIFSDLEVDVRPQQGRVQTERVGRRYRMEIEREVEVTLGGGGPEMQVKTFNGNIYLRRAR